MCTSHCSCSSTWQSMGPKRYLGSLGIDCIYHAVACIHHVCNDSGDSQVVEELVSNLGVIEKLTTFEHKDANGKDWGLNVRQRAKDVVALVNDPERMRAERQKVNVLTFPWQFLPRYEAGVKSCE